MNKPCISPNIDISELEDGRYSIFNKVSKKTYFIGALEYSVLISLDGTMDIEDIAKKINKLRVNELAKLVKQFEIIGFLKESEVKRKNTITRLTIGVLNPNKFLKQNSIFVEIFSFIITYLSLPIFILALWSNRNYFTEYVVMLRDGFSIETVIIIILLTVILLFFHEVSHVIVARKYGVNVPELGIILYWFMPGAYVNLSGVAYLKSKRQKIRIFLAGIQFNILASGIALWGCFFVNSGIIRYYLLWIAIDNFFNAVFNLLIALKLDGYLILKEIIEEEYLRERSFQYLKSIAVNRLTNISGILNKKRQQFYNYRILNESKTGNKAVYFAYSIFALLYIPILLLSILLTWISYIR